MKPRPPYHKIIKGNQMIQAALNGKPTTTDFKIGCKKCFNRGYIGIKDNGYKIPCKCMTKQIDYLKI